MRVPFLFSIAFLALVLANSASKTAPVATSFETWLQEQKQVSIGRMLANISPAETVAGTVIASPSRDHPNYYFNWVRDSALVMNAVVELYARTHCAERATYRKHLQDFINLSRRQQLSASAEGLGEPRYLVTGEADTIPWSRPQYDGPALRALSLLRWIELDLTARLDPVTMDVLKTDLDFVATMWSRPSFDLWEELRGLHFYTQAVQYSALRSGASFFSSTGDHSFAQRLNTEANAVEAELEKYWDSSRGYIGVSRELELRPDQAQYKDENLDTAVILAAIHVGPARPKILSLTGDQILATAEAIERAFTNEYRINHGQKNLAIGRFTDDVYFGGNPWYMTTAAFAEFYYNVARAVETEGGLTVTKINQRFLRSTLGRPLKVGFRISAKASVGQTLISKLRMKGDGFLRVVRNYMGDRGQLSEQFDRDAGVPVSAANLTWSYASLLTAIHQRDR